MNLNYVVKGIIGTKTGEKEVVYLIENVSRIRAKWRFKNKHPEARSISVLRSDDYKGNLKSLRKLIDPKSIFNKRSTTII